MYLNRKSLNQLQKQRGFLIPLSLFIVVVIGVLALTIARTSTQTNTASIQELLSVQAFYAAESGTQRGMQLLFFPDPTSRKNVDGRCVGMSQTYSFTGITGLQHCTAQVTCSCQYSSGATCSPSTAANYLSTTSAALATSFYKVTTVASCGQTTNRADRTIQAGAFLEQE